jgi:formylglycine-generating enzyme required for sulfatase activity
MVYIPGGQFFMGSPESEGKRYSNERPQHKVTVKQFLISKYPITQAQWREVASLSEVRQKLKPRPSRNGGKSHPITQVSWFNAIEFCDRLSQKTGKEYRLPTEAEWEYACRAGTTTPFHFGETITSNLVNCDNSRPYRSEPKGIYLEKTTQVGSFEFANPFGLFDMHGLVWEWCLDHWHENYNNAPTNEDAWLDSGENQNRVIRGGSWLNDNLCVVPVPACTRMPVRCSSMLVLELFAHSSLILCENFTYLIPDFKHFHPLLSMYSLALSPDAFCVQLEFGGIHMLEVLVQIHQSSKLLSFS